MATFKQKTWNNSTLVNSMVRRYNGSDTVHGTHEVVYSTDIDWKDIESTIFVNDNRSRSLQIIDILEDILSRLDALEHTTPEPVIPFTMKVTSNSSSLNHGQTSTLTATKTAGTNDYTSSTTWSITSGPSYGRLSSTSGSSVTFTAINNDVPNTIVSNSNIHVYNENNVDVTPSETNPINLTLPYNGETSFTVAWDPTVKKESLGNHVVKIGATNENTQSSITGSPLSITVKKNEKIYEFNAINNECSISDNANSYISIAVSGSDAQFDGLSNSYTLTFKHNVSEYAELNTINAWAYVYTTFVNNGDTFNNQHKIWFNFSVPQPEQEYYWYVGKDESLLGKDGTSYDLNLNNLESYKVNSIDDIYTNSQSVEDIENNIYVVCPTEWVGQFKLTDLDNNEIPQSDKTSQITSGVTGYSILRSNGKGMDSTIKVVRN